MATMIEVDHIGKQYRLGGQDGRYRSLRENLMRILSHPLQALVGQSGDDPDFWALRDVSFSVDEGEVVGIIGRNGAGKSTLLKLLARITRPTEGSAKLFGRVGSLLEVGTGFHPELTGRENIFLSGNLLGMTRAEVRLKFDEIVAFAEVERFLDTPVKHYSSGMYVRLGFAIAAHLEPEILLVDEVLAVGDAQFQKRCLGKMGEVAKAGRTVIFVSHNMAAIQSLCRKGILIDHGMIGCIGDIDTVLEKYERESLKLPSGALPLNADSRCGSGVMRFSKIKVLTHGVAQEGFFSTGCDCSLLMQIECTEDAFYETAEIGVGFDSLMGRRILHMSTLMSEGCDLSIPSEHSFWVRLDIPKVPLMPGEYMVSLFLRAGGEIIDWIQNGFLVSVKDGDPFGTGRLPESTDICISHSFSIEKE